MNFGGLGLGVCVLFLFSAVSEGGRASLNDKEVPASLDDLREIQAALQANLERARAATVCLQLGEGSGSAVIISEDGLVLTAAHVTGKIDEEITVVMEDGRELRGVSLGLNSETDSAMLQIIDEGPFPFVEVDHDDTSLLGDWVFSLGHSGGFDKERGVNVRVGRLVRQADATIQSDCMLIGGDSGGPLFNMEGELVGIHSRVGASREESMHVPIREFDDHWEALKNGEFIGEGAFAKKVEPGSGFLGVMIEEVEKGEAAEGGGLMVKELFPDGVAEVGGLQVGDRIVEIDGVEATEALFDEKLAQLGTGEELTLKWLRGEEPMEKTLKLGERP